MTRIYNYHPNDTQERTETESDSQELAGTKRLRSSDASTPYFKNEQSGQSDAFICNQ